jgi:TonB family protein
MPVAEPQDEAKPLDLLIDWEHAWIRPKPWYSALGSVIAHLLIFGVVLALPEHDYTQADFPRGGEIDIRGKAVTLVVPQDILTQKAPNRNKPADQLDLAGLMSSPQPKPVAPKIKAPPPAPKAFNAPPPSPAPPTAKPVETNLDPAPRIAQNLPPVLGGGANIPAPVIAPPPVPAPDKPRLTFETPGSVSGAPKGQIQSPSQMSIADQAKAAAATRNGSQGSTMVIGDLSGDPTPGIPALPGTQGKTGNSLELLSDPMGVDFKPYLIRVLAAVRRNWFAVMPESARMGMRGRTTIQFAIAKNGSVPKLVIHFPSGSEHLDRAAVAGISASNPFPPLPAEFQGNQIRLQLVFAYNMPR